MKLLREKNNEEDYELFISNLTLDEYNNKKIDILTLFPYDSIFTCSSFKIPGIYKYNEIIDLLKNDNICCEYLDFFKVMDTSIPDAKIYNNFKKITLHINKTHPVMEKILYKCIIREQTPLEQKNKTPIQILFLCYDYDYLEKVVNNI